MLETIALCHTNEISIKPTHLTEDEWFAIDLHDPLMMVC